MTETILMPLLDEGTDVWRPVEALALSDGSYEILGTAPDGEAWAFPAGSVVRREIQRFAGGEQGLAAVELRS